MALQEQADELFNQFNYKNLDAMVRLMKTVLENIRKRVIAATKSVITYGNLGGGSEENDEVKKDIPVFKTYAILATPNLIIQPSVDEMQQSLNKCISNITSLAKNVHQWQGRTKKQTKKKDNIGKDTSLLTIGEKDEKSEEKTEDEKSSAEEKSEDKGDDVNKSKSETPKPYSDKETSINESAENKEERSNSGTPAPANASNTQESRPQSSVSSVIQINYFKQITENKEVIKVMSFLNSCLLMSKNDVNNEIENFKRYEFIWQKDRDDDLKEFLLLNPQVTEFEAKVRFLTLLSVEINEYPEQLNVSIASILLEKLKIGFDAEIKIWKSYYGNACNQVYKTEINEILGFIEDAVKRLQRDIKDLDDIRSSMAVNKRYKFEYFLF